MIAVILLNVLDSGFMQFKMTEALKKKLVIYENLEKRILQIESNLELGLTKQLKEVTFLGCIPDSLMYGEKGGTNYYRTQVYYPDHSRQSVITSIAIRKKQLLEEKQDDQTFFIQKPKRLVKILVRNKNNAKLPVISIIDCHLGTSLKDFTLPIPEHSDISSDLSDFAMVDIRQNGSVSAIYFGYLKGLWKITFNKRDPLFWELKSWPIVRQGEIKKIIVGRHPANNGVLLYLQSYHNALKQGVLQVFWEKKYTLTHLFTIEQDQNIGDSLLRLDYLLIAIGNKIKMYDALSGAFIREQYLKFEHFFQEAKDEKGIYILEKEPRENQRQILVINGNEVRSCKMNVDDQRLGRRTWRMN